MTDKFAGPWKILFSWGDNDNGVYIYERPMQHAVTLRLTAIYVDGVRSANSHLYGVAWSGSRTRLTDTADLDPVLNQQISETVLAHA